MATLVNLDGLSKESINATFIKSAKEITKLTKDLALTAANTHGAINVWIDDDGKFRGNIYKFYVLEDSIITHDILHITNWLKKSLIKIK